MTQVIRLDGVEHNFPDDATREEITGALATHEQTAPTEQDQGLLSKLKKTIEPLTSAPEAVKTLAEQATELYGKGWKDIASGDVIKGAGEVGLGTVQYATSPIAGPMHTIFGKPTEDFVRSAGGSDRLANSIGGGVETALGFALPIPKGMPRFSSTAKVAEKAAPSVEQLDAVAKAGFQRPEIAELEIKPAAAQTWADGVRANLTESGIDENLAPKTWAILRGFDKAPPGATITGKNLQSLRRTFGRAAGTPDPSERKAATAAIDLLDKFVAKVPPEAVLNGEPDKVAMIWNEARGNYAAARRSEKITDAVDAAKNQTGSANSGLNIDNATRQKIKSILNNPKARRGYSGEELQQMQRIVRGTFTGDAARYLGNLLGGGGGLGTIVTAGTGAAAGSAAHGPIGAAVGATLPVIGYAFKKLSNVITSKNVEALDALVRSRSPLGAQMRGPLQSFAKAGRDLESSRTPRNIARVTLASRNLANNLKDAGILISPDDLVKSIQGPQSTNADEAKQQPPRVGDTKPNGGQ